MDAFRPRLATSVLLGLWCLALAPACGSSGTPGFSDAATDLGIDQGVVVNPRPDAGFFDALGRVCTRSSQCDDGVDCTEDFCSADGRCVNLPNSTSCDNHVYCDGMETCDARRGCIRGEPVSCSGNNACVTDRCDEATRACVHAPRDFDHDGDPDIHCHAPECGDAGVPLPDSGLPTPCWIGGDCDDTNPNINSHVPELCGNLIDDNCNGFIDDAEPGGCLRPPHQTCADAVDISAGGHFTLQTAGTTGMYSFMCAGGMLTHEIVARLHVATPQDVTLTASGNSVAVFMQVENVCGSTASADIRACTLGFPSTFRAHSLPAGDYYVLLGLSGGPATGTPIDVEVTLSPGTPAPTNDNCMTPGTIPSTGGHVTGDLIGVASPVVTRCGGPATGVVYSLTLPTASDVTARLTGGRSDYMQLALLDTCSRTATTLQCDSGAPAQFTAHNLAAGTYIVSVQGTNTPSYTLDVTVGLPTAAPPGDTCAMPLALTPNTTVAGTLMGRSGDFALSCAGSGSSGVVYSFTLTERSDVTANVRGGLSDYYYLAIDGTCGNQASERGCRFGAPGRMTLRGLDPGTYFLEIKGLRPSDFTLSLTATPPVAPMAVTGNDVCTSAWAIPSGGGLFTGNTMTLHHDYMCPCVPAADAEDAVFHYHVDTRQHVSFSTEGSSFDTILWLAHADGCPGTNVPTACNDDAIGTAAAFDVTLDPGDYNLFLGGFAMGAHGAYTLSVVTSAP